MNGIACRRCGRPTITGPRERWCVACGTVAGGLGQALTPLEDSSPASSSAPRDGSRWTPAELAFLFRSRDRRSTASIAEALGRSRHAIEQKLSKQGWKKPRLAGSPPASAPPSRPWARWTPEELNVAISKAATAGVISIPGRSPEAIRKAIAREEGALRELDGCLSERQAAEEFRVHRMTLYRLRRRGVLRPAWRWASWRYTPEELEAALGRRRPITVTVDVGAGYVTEAGAARIYGAPRSRIRELRRRGLVAGEQSHPRGPVRIAVAELEALGPVLTAPRQTWRAF